MNLLMIDDDAGDVRLVTLALKEARPDCALEAGGTLAEGLERLAAGGVDLLLLDLHLPDSQGLDTVDAVAETHAEMPIVVLTGLDSEDAGVEALRRGASDYLVKDKLSADLLGRTIRYSMERKRLEQRLVFLAHHDPLTGTWNRRTLEEAVERASARARRGQVSSLLLFDIDRFKQINDTLGHGAGDDVLVELAGCAREQLREEDVLARVGGDEFAALLEGTDPDEAAAIAERVREAVTAWGRQSDLDPRPTLSIGVVEVDGQRDYEALIAQADACLYQAKEQGRDRVVCASAQAQPVRAER